MSSETFGDSFAGSTDSAFIAALQKYIADGHRVTEGNSLDPDAPTWSFTVRQDIFEGYLLAQRLEPDGDD